jgi:hypothetical protein
LELDLEASLELSLELSLVEEEGVEVFLVEVLLVEVLLLSLLLLLLLVLLLPVPVPVPLLLVLLLGLDTRTSMPSSTALTTPSASVSVHTLAGVALERRLFLGDMGEEPKVVLGWVESSDPSCDKSSKSMLLSFMEDKVELWLEKEPWALRPVEEKEELAVGRLWTRGMGRENVGEGGRERKRAVGRWGRETRGEEGETRERGGKARQLTLRRGAAVRGEAGGCQRGDFTFPAFHFYNKIEGLRFETFFVLPPHCERQNYLLQTLSYDEH